MNLKNMMQKRLHLMIWRLVLVLLSILCMISIVGLFRFDTKAVSWNGVSVAPRSCSVGDTITISVDGSPVNEYRYSYKYGSYSEPVIYITDWVSYSTCDFVPEIAGNYYFLVYAKDSNSSTNSSYILVTVSESSVESSAESSVESSAESSIPLPFLPSDWGGSAYVQPSADSTPSLEVALPSDIQVSVSSGMSSILSDAFQAFPAPLLALIIPSVICLFIGWWLHK